MRATAWIVALAATAASAEPAVKKTPPPPSEPKPEMAALTNDPILGKADRIEGDERDAGGLVAFTFDDGPNPNTTPAVLDALEKYNIPATFFIVSQRIVGKSQNAEKTRAVLQREMAAGFLTESHSYTHPNLRGASAKTLAHEVDDAIRALNKETGRTIGVFRAPYGALDNNSRALLKKRGLTEAFWSVDTLDWKASDPARLRRKVVTMITKQNGGVVLMHDVKPITAKVIGEVLDDLEAENCKRLADPNKAKAPIWPVSIHYFLRDKNKPRAIPADVEKATESYKAALPGRCAKRPPPPPKPDPKDPKSPPKSNPANQP